jgi:putative spermidine/putrescine transport system substrate-binding protein
MSDWEPKTKSCVDLTRRQFLTTATGAGAAALAGPLILTPGKAQASAVVRVADDGGTLSKARERLFFKPFMERTGIEVQVYVGQHDLAKMKAMIQTDNLEYDIVLASGSIAAAATKSGLLAEIDKTKMDLSNYMIEEWNQPTWIAWQYYTAGLTYNTKNITPEKVPGSWAEYWDTEKFPGRRGFRTSPYETLEQALLADGIAIPDLYPVDLDRAFTSLDKIKDNVNVWVAETSQTVQLLQQNELDFCVSYSGRVEQARANGVPIAFAYDYAISSPTAIWVMKGTPNYDASLKIMQWFLTGEPGVAWFTEFPGNGPTDRKTFEALAEEIKAKLPKFDNPSSVWVDVNWWADNFETATVRYKTWLLS